MRMLFVGSRSFNDLHSIRGGLTRVAGTEPVDLVVAYDSRGAEWIAAEWAYARAKRDGRTTVDTVRLTSTFGPERTERPGRRDAHMLSLGPFDVVVIAVRRAGRARTSDRPDNMAAEARRRGWPVAEIEYDSETLRAGM